MICMKNVSILSVLFSLSRMVVFSTNQYGIYLEVHWMVSRDVIRSKAGCSRF
jgi:hypothetical protein